MLNPHDNPGGRTISRRNIFAPAPEAAAAQAPLVGGVFDQAGACGQHDLTRRDDHVRARAAAVHRTHRFSDRNRLVGPASLTLLALGAVIALPDASPSGQTDQPRPARPAVQTAPRPQPQASPRVVRPSAARTSRDRRAHHERPSRKRSSRPRRAPASRHRAPVAPVAPRAVAPRRQMAPQPPARSSPPARPPASSLPEFL